MLSYNLAIKTCRPKHEKFLVINDNMQRLLNEKKSMWRLLDIKTKMVKDKTKCNTSGKEIIILS